jgi:LPPG:FO 2-phospho-L-lactate transferase
MNAAAGPVVVLAGGTGGAKLARGMLDVVGSDLVAVVNTGDDVEVHGAYVSPDPDLVTFWLADVIDERGWGIAGDTFEVMGALRDLGEEVWFNLGDRDLALGLWRAERLRTGDRLTAVAADAARSYGVRGARVLPMCDEPVRTWVDGTPFQEWMIRGGGKDGAPVTGVEFRGAAQASATPEVIAAILGARAVIVGPSNPVISIGPILAVPGVREALAETPAPVVAVSPLVRGEAVKGPTEDFMAYTGHPLTAAGIAATYAGLIDGLVADDDAPGLPTLLTDVLMPDATGRGRLARETLDFALGLSRRRASG